MRCRSRKVRKATWQQVTRLLADQHGQLRKRVDRLRRDVNKLKAAERPNTIGFRVQHEEDED